MAQDFNLTMPTERAEKYLAKMAKAYDGTLPEPISNIDKYLKILAENGSGGGSGGGITPKKLENADLNTVTETGSYYADFDHTCKNVPDKVGSYGFSIIVTNGGGVVYQLLMKNTIAEENRLFMRVIDSDGEVYPWSNYMQESDVTVDSTLSETSTRPPQNAIVTKRLNEIESNSAKKTDLTAYLPKSGGEMSGNIDIATNQKELLINIAGSTSKTPSAVVSGYVKQSGTLQDAIVPLRSFMGTYTNSDTGVSYAVISVRHYNGFGADGKNRGISIYSELNNLGKDLKWNRQYLSGGVWQGERTLLDSANFSDYALPKDGTAKTAETLTDSGWTIPDPICNKKTTSIKYKKYGNIVEISGSITFSQTYTDAEIFQLPEDCRPHSNIIVLGSSFVTPCDYFQVKVSNDGYVTFLGKTDNFFNTMTNYSMHATFLVD